MNEQDRLRYAKNCPGRAVGLSDDEFWSMSAKDRKKKTGYGVVWNVQCASANITLEIDPIFFSTHTFTSSRPQHLMKLIDRLQFLDRENIRPRVNLRLDVHILTVIDWLVRYKGENAWSKAFKWLPSPYNPSALCLASMTETQPMSYG